MDNGRPFRISGSEDSKRSRHSRSSGGKSSEGGTAEEKKSSKRAASAAANTADPVEVEAVNTMAIESESGMESATKSTPVKQGRSRGRSKKPVVKWIALLVVLGLVLAGGYMAWSRFASTEVLPGANKYQAVTTTDGQIYFGKVKSLGSEYVEINDGYYLQPTASGESSGGQVDTGRLVRLSNRLYGPDGSIVIPKTQILSFEVLDPDGQIVQMMGDGS